MPLFIKKSKNLLKTTFAKWNKREPFRQSAVIAYYSIFSIPGLLALIISITGYFFDKELVNQNILSEISNTMGVNIAKQVEEIIIKSTQPENATIWGSIIGGIILIIGATGVFVEMQKTLNSIWQVKPSLKKGIWRVVKARLFSFGLILAIAFLLLVSLVISTALAAMGEWIKPGASGILIVVYNSINFLFSLVVISVLFALIFKILPDTKIKWKDVWLGSFITGVLFTFGKTVLAFYFGKANPGSAYGAAGSIILILLWVSYSSMILFWGAEFTATYSALHNSKTESSEITKSTIGTKTPSYA